MLTDSSPVPLYLNDDEGVREGSNEDEGVEDESEHKGVKDDDDNDDNDDDDDDDDENDDDAVKALYISILMSNMSFACLYTSTILRCLSDDDFITSSMHSLTDGSVSDIVWCYVYNRSSNGRRDTFTIT